MTNFWQGRKVFVTSPSSFRGSWLCLHLLKQGAQVYGYGPSSEADESKLTPHLFNLENIAQKIGMTFGRLTEKENLLAALNFAEAEVVIHLGAERRLSETRENPLASFEDEVMGTATLMDCLRQTATVRSVVVLSSDKVYQRQSENLAGKLMEDSPIAASEVGPTTKLCSELVALSFQNQFFSPDKFNKHKVSIAVVRVGPAVGGGDFSEESFVAQAMQSFLAHVPLVIRKPGSTRTWIDIDDQVSGLLMIAQSLLEKGPRAGNIWNLSGEISASVSVFAEALARAWNVSHPGNPEAQVISPEISAPSFHPVLSSEKLKRELNWAPEFDLAASAQKIVNWYKNFHMRAR